MAVTVVLTVTPGIKNDYPAGTQLAGYRAFLQVADQATSAVAIDAPDLSAPFEFPNTVAGPYIAAVVRLDASGNAVATLNVDAFAVPDTVPPIHMSGDAPASVQISFK